MSDKVLLEKLAAIEHEQWCEWSKSISKDLRGLLNLCPIESLSGDDMTLILDNLDRLDRWGNILWKPYDELSEEMKEEDREYARKVLKVLKEMD
jgi:alpha-amylase/alpha-mannosidase (GH57 family)